jgi:hypothetical protein
MENDKQTHVPGWNAVPGRFEIITEGNAFRNLSRAAEVFRALSHVEKTADPILAVWHVDEQGRRRAAAPSGVGALNIYLGTVGLRGLVRTLGPNRSRAFTRWDLEQLFALCGIALPVWGNKAA